GERLTVLSGTANLGTGDRFDPAAARPLPPGGYAMLPPRMNHFAFAKGPVVVQVSGQGPFDIHYVNRADDPRGASAKYPPPGAGAPPLRRGPPRAREPRRVARARRLPPGRRLPGRRVGRRRGPAPRVCRP